MAKKPEPGSQYKLGVYSLYQSIIRYFGVSGTQWLRSLVQGLLEPT